MVASKVSHGSSPIGLLAAAGAAAVVGAVISLPALRLTGLYLALSTLAFAVLADHGIYHEPKFVSKVANGDGQVLESGPSREQHVLDPTVVTTVNRILSEVMTMGTGTGAQIGRPAAGKTGTAEDYKNAWFVGYTPRLATSVWVGYRNANQPLLGVEGVPKMAGGTIPAKIWATYMKAALGPADGNTQTADATDLGLINAPGSRETSTKVGTETVTSTVTSTGVPSVCSLLPSTTAVAPGPSPVTGTGYNQYPYLRAGRPAPPRPRLPRAPPRCRPRSRRCPAPRRRPRYGPACSASSAGSRAANASASRSRVPSGTRCRGGGAPRRSPPPRNARCR